VLGLSLAAALLFVDLVACVASVHLLTRPTMLGRRAWRRQAAVGSSAWNVPRCRYAPSSVLPC
jgi:hypothetical protein